MKWKILSSEYLHKTEWFTIRMDRCITPENKIVDPYYVYEFPTWAAAVALTEDDKVVMVRQYRHALGETLMEIPGGCIDPEDVDSKAGIARELLEETGYAFTNYEYLGRISANPSTNSNIMHMYLATGGKKVSEQHLDANEEIEVYLVSIEELKQMLADNQIIQAMHLSCIYYALAKLGKL